MSVFLLFCFLSPGFASTAYSQTSGASFLNVEPSAQANALGMSGVVTSMGAQAIGDNPSLLGNMSSRFELFTSYASLLGGVQYGNLSAAMALPSSFVDSLGLSVARLQVGGIDGADSSGNATGSSLNSGNTAVGLSASGRIGSGLRLGLTGKAIKENIAGYTSNTALAGDLGMTYTPHLSRFRGLSIGASVNNIGQGIKFLNQTDPLPASASLGVSVPVGPAMGIVTANRMINEKTTNVGIGMEYALGPLDLRGGFLAQGGGAANLAAQDQSPMGRLMNGMMGGLGLHLGNAARLDYAVSEQATGAYGAAQRVSLTLQFGDKNGFKTASANHKQNTKTIEPSPWRQSGSDTVDWRMIRLEK